MRAGSRHGPPERVVQYHAYGMAVASAINLPELIPQALAGTPDLTISLGPVRPHDRQGVSRFDEHHWAGPRELYLAVPGVATYGVEDGRRVTVDLQPGADADSVRLYLLGSCLGAILMQRGQLVLHGNAIRLGDQCVVCVGASGAGKSTLSAAFMRRGFQVLSDDVAAIDSQWHVLPGVPCIKLWGNAAFQLGMSTEGKRPVQPGVDKFNFPSAAGFSTRPTPVGRIYVLTPGEGTCAAMTALAGRGRLSPLIENTYRPQFVTGMGLQARHLLQCADLAGRVKVAALGRPRLGYDVDGVVDAILNDAAQNQ